MIKIKEKIMIVNILTVASAILTIFSLSYMQGFSTITFIAVIIAASFAKLTYVFFCIETLLRTQLKLSYTKRQKAKRAYYQAVSNKKILPDVGLVG